MIREAGAGRDVTRRAMHRVWGEMLAMLSAFDPGRPKRGEVLFRAGGLLFA